MSISPFSQSASADTGRDGAATSPHQTISPQTPQDKLSLAYPRIEFSRRSRNWWAWLKGMAPECIHLDRNAVWMATLLPDTLYLCGKRSVTREVARPEVSLCRDCLIDTVAMELAAYSGKVVAFEPDAEAFTQYFFLATRHFERAGLKPEVSRAVELRLAQKERICRECAQPGTWLWFSREDVASLDEVESIRGSAGQSFCPEHGSGKLCNTFKKISEANLFYMNLPYGETGAYVWI